MKWKGDPEEKPFLSKTLPPLVNVENMLYLQISDHLFNSYCRAAFTNDMLSFEVTDQEVSNKVKQNDHFLFFRIGNVIACIICY